MKKSRRLATGLAGLLAVAGAGGCGSGGNYAVPDVRFEIQHLAEREDEQNVFGCSSALGIKQMFLFGNGRMYELKPRDIGNYPLGGKPITRWIGDVPKDVPRGKYELLMVTGDGKLLREGNYEVEEKPAGN